MRQNNLVIAVSIIYIILFVYASLTKLMDIHTFTIQLGKAPILTHMAIPLAWGVPAVELVVVILLAFDKTRLIGLYASVSLMTMFTTYVVLASKFSDYVPCTCGGVIESLTWNQHIVFNVSFLLLGVIVILQPLRYRATIQRE